jgi:hypothetical protein
MAGCGQLSVVFKMTGYNLFIPLVSEGNIKLRIQVCNVKALWQHLASRKLLRSIIQKLAQLDELWMLLFYAGHQLFQYYICDCLVISVSVSFLLPEELLYPVDWQ